MRSELQVLETSYGSFCERIAGLAGSELEVVVLAI